MAFHLDGIVLNESASSFLMVGDAGKVYGVLGVFLSVLSFVDQALLVSDRWWHIVQGTQHAYRGWLRYIGFVVICIITSFLLLYALYSDGYQRGICRS